MKSSQFRIKNGLANKFQRKEKTIEDIDNDSRSSNHPHDTNNLLPTFDHNETLHMGRFLDFFKDLTNRMSQKREDFEVRDRYYMLDLPSGKSYSQKQEVIKQWLQKMVSGTVSIAFNYYCKEELTYEQTKIFCSENILRNISALTHKFKLCLEELREVDEHIRDESLTYLLKKYPMTESIVVNRALDAAAKSPDHSQALENDFLNYGQIRFEFKQNQNYDDMIKQTINEIINRLNEGSNLVQGNSHFGAFERLMTKVFESVEDKDFMDGKQQLYQQNISFEPKSFQSISDDSFKKRQYRQKVKEYTSFLIGRKISENVSGFSAEELKMKNVMIKHSGILRILTKWSEQLWEKFIPKNYYLNKKEDFRLVTGEIKPLSQELRSKLDSLMQKEKAEIKQYMAKIVRENYEIQLNLLHQLMEGIDGQYSSEILEKVSGKFAVLIGKSLEREVVKYLNRLIHGLLKVAKLFHEQFVLSEWQSPPNLITFRIGDLLRCKCSSGQRQILKILHSLKRICETHPQILQIVRIKNRLNLGTNDILINMRFCNLIVCEIQLSVNSKKTRFIKASNGMSHYLYELQRSLFGPINELCSIWRNLEIRASHYTKNIGRQLGEARVAEHKCQSQAKSFEFEIFEGPFVCNICNSTYAENDLLMKHVKCSECAYWKCGMCRIRLSKPSQLIELLITDPKLKPLCTKTFEKKYENDELPVYGVAVSLQPESNKVATIFKRFIIRGVTYLFFFDEEIKVMAKLSHQNDQKKFLLEHLIFEIGEQQGRNLIDLNELQITQQYMLPKYVSQSYQQKKTALIIDKEPLNSHICEKVFAGTEEQRRNITYLEIRSTEITSVQPIGHILPCLKELSLIENSKMESLKGIADLKELKILQLSHTTQLKVFPQQICELTSLEQLQLKNNDFATLPEQIGQLIHLRKLNLTRIESTQFKYFIRVLPSSLYTLQYLQSIDLSNQFVCSIEVGIGNLKHLTYLNLRKNNIRELPDSLNDLVRLEYLDVSENPIEKFPIKMGNLKRLQNFEVKHLGRNRIRIMGDQIFRANISQLPQDIEQIPNLIVINVHSDQLKTLPSLKKCNNLQEINFQRCSLTAYPQLPVCQNLKRFSMKQQMTVDEEHPIQQISENYFCAMPNAQVLNLAYNSLSKFPKNIAFLTQLISLNLQYNLLTSLPESIGECVSLRILNAWHNRLTSLPQTLSNLRRLQQITLSENMFTSFPTIIIECQNLKVIELNGNKIDQIPESIWKLTNLQEFNFQNNLAQIVPFQLQKLKKIKPGGLRLKLNPIFYIGCMDFVQKTGCEGTKSLKNSLHKGYYSIRRFSQKLQHVSSKIKLAINLKNFNISQNQFKNLPQEFGFLQNLQEAVISYNKFEAFPLQLTLCKGIKTLSCQGNLLSELPSEIGNLTNLFFLNASSNRLVTICPQIVGCVNLSELYLGGNLIEDLPTDVLSGLNKLTKISLSVNKLKSFPQGLLHCPSLIQIYLSQNQMQVVEGDFNLLMNLQQLYLSKNSIAIFPKDLTKCGSLKELYMDSNKLQNISNQIDKLVNLCVLNLSSNMIKEIPRSIGKCKSLHSAILSCNLIEVAIRELSQLSGISDECINLYQNPIQMVECYDWLMKKGSSATKQLIAPFQPIS